MCQTFYFHPHQLIVAVTLYLLTFVAGEERGQVSLAYNVFQSDDNIPVIAFQAHGLVNVEFNSTYQQTDLVALKIWM